MTKRLLIVGSGKRVREAALPALARARAHWTLAGVRSRKRKTLEHEGAALAVEPLDALAPADLDGVDLVYVVVAKPAVPAVLRRLLALGPDVVGRVDLLVETPVLLFKHLGHLALLERFRNAWVAEDCVALPFFDPVAALVAAGAVGTPRRLHLERSAYAYHGIAMARALLGDARVRSGKRVRADGGLARRRVRFASGTELTTLDPRDYTKGRIALDGTGGTIADDPARSPDHLLGAIVESGRCTGFRAGDAACALDEDERALMGEPTAGEGVTAWMEGSKRVGFLRTLRRLAQGRGAYPLASALEDTVVDWHLERLGRYVANPLTSVHFASARLLLRALTRVAGG